MISYIVGTFRYIGDGFIIVEAGGIGYSIQTSLNTINRLPALNTQVKMYTYMNVSENDISLFGFLSMDELNMFNKLKTVNGVGAKSALAILGTLSPSELSVAVITEDIRQLSKCPGIGKKTAQRIALELRDKISNEDALGQSVAIGSTETEMTNEKSDAVQALIALGFSKSEAIMAVSRIEDDNFGSDRIVSQALKILSR